MSKLYGASNETLNRVSYSMYLEQKSCSNHNRKELTMVQNYLISCLKKIVSNYQGQNLNILYEILLPRGI